MEGITTQQGTTAQESHRAITSFNSQDKQNKEGIITKESTCQAKNRRHY
jgi:hypothetical protein